MSIDGETLNFEVEWYDNQAQNVRVFSMSYFLLDNTLELNDLVNHRTFLKRCPYPELSPDQLYIGAKITVYSRQLCITKFGDEFTRRKLSDETGRVLIIVHPQRLHILGDLLLQMQSVKIKVSRVRSLKLTKDQAMEYLGERQLSPLANLLSSGTLIAMELIGPAAKAALAKRAEAGEVIISEKGSVEEVKFLFENVKISHTAVATDCSICIVKPHVWFDGKAGSIVNELQNQFGLTAVQLMYFDRMMAGEYMDAYQGVVPECNSLIDELCRGPCLVIQVAGKECLKKLRHACGPPDPKIAIHIRPDCLRARFGTDKVRNAVHCTDLEEDGPLESGFFFETLQAVDSIKNGYY